MNLERIYSMKKQNAFTLAEVLITLGIIGVVAAMTMPSLLNATQGKQYVTAYKRALATMSQAGAINYALDDVDFSTTTTIGDILKKRMNVTKVDGNNIYFNDGSKLTVTDNAHSCTDHSNKAVNAEADDSGTSANCRLQLDVNGDKGPNVAGKDQFTVQFTRQGVEPADDSGRSIVTTDKLLQANQ